MTTTTETREHAELSPSMLDALALCPCYRSKKGEDSEAASRGRKMHDALGKRLVCAYPPQWKVGLEPDDAEEVDWAARWIETNLSRENRIMEEKVCIERDFQILTWGYLDFADTSPDNCSVVDFKTGEPRDCERQLAAYALGLMQRLGQEQCRVVALYSRYRQVAEDFISRQGAEALVYPVLEAAKDPMSKPQPCDYCGWCANRWSCHVHHTAGSAIVQANPDWVDVSDWLPSTWRPSEITEPGDMAKLLEIHAPMMKRMEQWSADVKTHALKMMETQEVAGWRRAEEPSDRVIENLLGAFQLLGWPAEDFLLCCKAVIGKMEKRYVKDVDNKAEAKRELAKKLEPFLAERTISHTLKRERKDKHT